MRTLIWKFYQHARNLEDRNRKPPKHLHNAFQIVASLATKFKPHDANMLACMNLPLELRRVLGVKAGGYSESFLTDYAWSAVRYLVEPCMDALPKNLVYSLDDDAMLRKVIEMDPDRRGFRPATVTMLLHYGANPSHVWNRLLSSEPMLGECSNYQREMMFKVSEELIRFGAQATDEDEESKLHELFGHCDAEALLALRTVGMKTATGDASRWKWLSWLRVSPGTAA